MAQFPLDPANQNQALTQHHLEASASNNDDDATDERGTGDNTSATSWLATSYAWLLLTGYVLAIIPEMLGKTFFTKAPHLPATSKAALASQLSQTTATEKDRA
jgi:hypothetical protein